MVTVDFFLDLTNFGPKKLELKYSQEMRNLILKFCVAFLFLTMLPFSVKGQEDDFTSPVNVFIDGSFIDENYLREEFPQVNYVRTKESSNVYLLATRQSTGAGSHYQFFFIGLEQFAGKDDTLHYYSNSQATSTEVREGYTNAIKAGLIRYLALSDTYFNLNIPSSNNQRRGGTAVEDDPWDSWVFDIRLNGNMSGESARKNQSYSGGLDISRVTHKWRYEFSLGYNSNTRITKYGDVDYKNITTSAEADYAIIKSLGPHAGIGLLGELKNDTYEMYDLNFVNSLAVEYNFFPYDMSSRRQLYVNYFIGIDDRNYSDTIAYYNVTEQTIPYHRFAVGYSQREQWGNVSANLSYRSFLDDFSRNRLSMSTNLSWRIWRGLSWNVNLSYSRIRDIINIPKDRIDPNDILTGVTRLPTSFSYSVRTGISFTFGSIYNNVVNTRLRGGGGYGGGGGGRY